MACRIPALVLHILFNAMERSEPLIALNNKNKKVCDLFNHRIHIQNLETVAELTYYHQDYFTILQDKKNNYYLLSYVFRNALNYKFDYDIIHKLWEIIDLDFDGDIENFVQDNIGYVLCKEFSDVLVSLNDLLRERYETVNIMPSKRWWSMFPEWMTLWPYRMETAIYTLFDDEITQIVSEASQKLTEEETDLIRQWEQLC